MREFAELFQKEAPGLQASMRSAINTRDASLLRRTAHTLKGSATYFGASALIEAAQALEIAGRAGTFDGLDTFLAKVASELTRVLAALESGPPTPIA